MIHCIMFSGVSLSDAARDALFQAACDCVRDEKNSKKVFNDDVQGEVYTHFDFFSLDSITGIVFESDIETENGESYAKFLVRIRDLEEARHNGEWLSFDEFIEKVQKQSKSHEWN